MRRLFGWALAPIMLAAAGSASAASLEIRNAALRVVVVPEARSDVSVTVIKTNPRLPLKVVNGFSGQVIVDGGRFGWFGLQPIWCEAGGVVHVAGVGRFANAELPQILVRVPLEAQVAAGGGVFGAVSASNRLDLDVSGCGEWVVGNVRGRLAVRSSSSSTVRTGGAGQMALQISGSGEIRTRAALGGLDADISGSGDIVVEAASGPVRIQGSGNGDVTVGGGAASELDVHVSGSGDVAFKGAAQDLRASISGSGKVEAGQATRSLDVDISGSGDMVVAAASGTVRARLSGSGDLKIAGGHASNIDARLSGGGDVDYAGVADSLDASLSGSADLKVARVTGAVKSFSSGSGQVIINR